MIISNAVVCDVNGEYKSDIRIEDGVITELGSGLEGGEIIDAKGAYFLPLLVDTNVRLHDSTLNSKNIKAISEEAHRGGVGHVILNADSEPAIDNEVVLEFAQNGLHELSGAKKDLMLKTLKEDSTLSKIAILLKSGAVGAGDGNGFKTGGSDDKTLKHNAVYKNCISAGNTHDGFDHNSNRGDVTMYNCSAYGNGNNISFGTGNIANSLTIKNTASLAGGSSDSFEATTTDISNNSWQNNISITSDEFVSLEMDLLSSPRNVDGSLPSIDFMKLATGSDLIDAGVDVGIEFTGSAPDLGAFEK